MGFIELAISAGVPVVPMTIHGAHETTFVLTRGHRIARELGVSGGTVRRSWDSAHPEEIQAAAEEGRTPIRGGYRHLPQDKIQRMREMVVKGETTTPEIAVAVGVSINTVRRERVRMLEEATQAQ